MSNLGEYQKKESQPRIRREKCIYIYIYIYTPTMYAVSKMSYTEIKRKDIHKISVIFRLFTNLLRTNLNKKCKIVYVIKIVIKRKEQ